MKLTNIDFDYSNGVAKVADEMVEIPVGQLWMLLSYFYTGGGEPALNSERLKASEDFKAFLPRAKKANGL